MYSTVFLLVDILRDYISPKTTLATSKDDISVGTQYRDDHATLFIGSQIEVSIREDLGRRARAEFMSNEEADEALTIAPRVCA